MIAPAGARTALAVAAGGLITTYVTMSEVDHGDDGPRTFVAALAAVCVGAWLYSACRHDDHDDGPPPP